MSLAPMDLLQDAVVTLVACAAMAVLFRRVLGFARPSAGPGCANCPSAAKSCHTPEQTTAPSASSEHPLVFVRPSQH